MEGISDRPSDGGDSLVGTLAREAALMWSHNKHLLSQNFYCSGAMETVAAHKLKVKDVAIGPRDQGSARL